MKRLLAISSLAVGAFVFAGTVETHDADACGVKLTFKAAKPRMKDAKTEPKLVAAKRANKDDERRRVDSKEDRVPVAAGPKARPTRRARNAGANSRPKRSGSAGVARKVAPNKPTVSKANKPAPKVAVTTTDEKPEPAEAVPDPKPARTAAAAPSGPPLRVEVYFELGEASVSESELQEVIEWLDANPNGRLVVEGHTDASGSPKFNQGLARRRALDVKRTIVKESSAKPKQIGVRSYGESKIAYPDEPSKNRRVVIKSR
jgi:outer membrane protein OmpA-like peptidoglycan-associated protein